MKNKNKKGFVKEIVEWKNAIIWSLLVFLFIVKPFLISGYVIPSGSMKDTLLIGDYLMVDKFTFGGKVPLTEVRLPGFRKPEPGDIVVFWSPEGKVPGFADKIAFWKKPKNIRLIKRCIAEGGQTVEVRDKILYIDGKPQSEKYVKHIDTHIYPAEMFPRDNFGPVTIPEGHYFMMGDNRDDSHDSRFFGTVSEKRIIGTPLTIYFSLDKNRKKIRFERILTIF